MKQKLLKSILLLCALIVESSNVWAETYTYTLSSGANGFFSNEGLTTHPGTGSSNKISQFYASDGKLFTASATNIYFSAASSGYLFVTSGVTLTLPTYSGEKITGISMSNSSGCSTSVSVSIVSGSNTAAEAQTWSSTSSTYNYTIAESYQASTLGVKVASKNAQITKIVITTEEVAPAGTTSAPTISGTETFLTSTTVTLTNAAASDGAKIYYTLNGEDPTTTTSATCFEYTEPFELTATTTVKAIAKHADDTNASAVESKTFTKVVPISVADAIVATPASGNSETVFVRGIVSGFYGSYTDITGDNSHRYYISDDGTSTDQFLVYNGKGLNNVAFSNVNDLLIGDEIVITGQLTTYSGTKEFAANNYIISLSRKVAMPTFSPLAGAVAAGTTVTISCATDGATIYYTTDGTEPTTSSSVYSSPITIDAAKTIKAFAVKTGNPDSEIATAAYTIALPADAPTFSVAAGTYYSVQSVELSSTTDEATIYYTTDGTEPTTESTEYTAAITVDETMTIKAIAAKEGMANSAVVEAAYTILLPSITVNNSIQFTYDEAGKSLNVFYTNINLETTPTVKFYESDGTTETTYDWFAAVIDGDKNLLITPEENEGDAARLAYVRICAKSLDNSDVLSSLITITQIKPVADYATLPFTFNSGKSSLPKGLTHTGLGSDYSSAPLLKFDTTNDEMVLKIKEIPGTLSFDVKGNGFSGGTFKVQTSVNGVDYTDLAIYTDLGDTQSEVFNNLAANVRYIKWVYTNKSSGNVGLGNIKLSNTVDVKLAASGYASFCSPLPLDLTPTEDYAAYAVTATSGETVTFKKITGAVPAATPFFLYGEGKGGTTVNLPIATGETTAVSGNMLAGTLAPTAITTVSGDYTNFGLSGGNFVKINDGTMKANKAYLPILTANVPAGARLSIVFDEGETTGVREKVTVNSDKFATAPVYNLNGQRVSQPTRGLYIVNGRKVLVP